jgi:hypothetical protein
VVANAEAMGADSDAIDLRKDPRRARLPMIAVCREMGDLSFAGAFSWGADDVVELNRLRPLLVRLRGLPREQPPEVTGARKAALIADTDPSRRVTVGRVLRNAGYNVTFAATSQDAVDFAQQKGLDLVVMSAELECVPRQVIEHAHAAGSHAKFMISCAPRDLRSCKAALVGLDHATAFDGYAPPENVLFLANELQSGMRFNQRASARILYGTTVAFRGAGRHEDDYGFAYNISREGIYVRTLAPPEDKVVWLELCPPRSERRVRLVGEVAWRRRFNYADGATVPPGFGVRIVDGAATDRAEWVAGYDGLAQALG